MLVVLLGWLILPVSGAQLLSCSMKCCRRSASFSHLHPRCAGIDVPEVTSRDAAGRPEIASIPGTCPAGCVLKGRSGAPVLPGRATVYTPISSRPRKIAPVTRKTAEPKLFTHACRAPPLAA